MRIPYYHVNAFTDRPFAGNPAGVCVLERWLPEPTMQAVAAENALAATAFVVPEGAAYGLRWFSPTVELDLCGHGTLAAAFVVLEFVESGAPAVRFRTRRAELGVERDGARFALDFPALPLEPCPAPPAELARALGRAPREVLVGRSYVALYDREEDVAALAPDMEALSRLDRPAVVASAPGRESDIASRNFAPAKGIPEDAVTGSAHALIVPYWSRVLGKTAIHARQISARGGTLWCELRGERVRIAGACTFYMKGEMRIAAGAGA
ncbi:MAG: PhzF family phenazine biosynthesis protein [Proteobacteria bacterium]|nr:PhzF family phenazine biosynthesis protein [Pseudomonadota bacterium]